MKFSSLLLLTVFGSTLYAMDSDSATSITADFQGKDRFTTMETPLGFDSAASITVDLQGEDPLVILDSDSDSDADEISQRRSDEYRIDANKTLPVVQTRRRAQSDLHIKSVRKLSLNRLTNNADSSAQISPGSCVSAPAGGRISRDSSGSSRSLMSENISDPEILFSNEYDLMEVLNDILTQQGAICSIALNSCSSNQFLDLISKLNQGSSLILSNKKLPDKEALNKILNEGISVYEHKTDISSTIGVLDYLDKKDRQERRIAFCGSFKPEEETSDVTTNLFIFCESNNVNSLVQQIILLREASQEIKTIDSLTSAALAAANQKSD